jgi:hypothetical protein
MFKTIALSALAASATAFTITMDPTDFAQVEVVEHLFDSFFTDLQATSFSQCGGDHYSFSSGSVNPDPIQKGSTASLSMTGSFDQATSISNVHYDAAWNGITVKSEDDARDGSSHSGDYTYAFEYDIPRFSPSGNYVITVTGTDGSNDVFCVDLSFSL